MKDGWIWDEFHDMTVFVREKWSEYIKIHKVQTFTFSCIDQPHEHLIMGLLWKHITPWRINTYWNPKLWWFGPDWFSFQLDTVGDFNLNHVNSSGCNPGNVVCLSSSCWLRELGPVACTGPQHHSTKAKESGLALPAIPALRTSTVPWFDALIPWIFSWGCCAHPEKVTLKRFF